MSWDSYVDNLIGQTKDATGGAHCDRACIFGLDGGAMWTSATPPQNMKPSPEETASLAQIFKSKRFQMLQTNGVMIEGIKYQYLRTIDDVLVMCKKKDHGAVSMQASKTAIVIGHVPEGKQMGNLNKGIDVIAKYLESLNM